MRRTVARRREPTITLINIVFLLLIFFLVAGTLAPPLDRDVQLVKTSELAPSGPPDALVIHPDGRLSYQGQTLAAAADFLANAPADVLDRARIVPDRDLPAETLIAVARDLRLAGVNEVVIVTESGLR